jgi:hypothetical protein
VNALEEYVAALETDTYADALIARIESAADWVNLAGTTASAYEYAAILANPERPHQHAGALRLLRRILGANQARTEALTVTTGDVVDAAAQTAWAITHT